MRFGASSAIVGLAWLFAQSATAQFSTSTCHKYFREDARVPQDISALETRFGDQAARVCRSPDGEIVSYHAIYHIDIRPHHICAFTTQKRSLSEEDRKVAKKHPEFFGLNEFWQVANRCPRQDNGKYAFVYDVPDRIFTRIWSFHAHLISSPRFARSAVKGASPQKLVGTPSCADLLQEIAKADGALSLRSVERNTHREIWPGEYLVSLRVDAAQSWQLVIDLGKGEPKVNACDFVRV